jgi:hypothetical protein
MSTRTLRSTRGLAALCTVVALAGCVTDLETSQTEQGLGCTKYICGNNSPILGGLPFFELDETGVTPAPDSGLRIVGFWKWGFPLAVDVSGARLTGITAWGATVQGNGLVGAVLHVQNAQGVTYRISIDSVTVPPVQPYWELGADGTMLESYGLSYTVLGQAGRPRRVCPIQAPTTEWTTPPYHALIFQGDRIDADTGRVVATGAAAGPWFNVACAGDVLAKLLVIRHAEAAQDAAHTTSPLQRTAAIRMFRADYCSDGPNTALGVPLDWANVGGWNVLGQAATEDNVEAVWRGHGAVCLTNPRYIDLDDVTCDLDPCTEDQIDNWQDYGDFITINP